MANELDIRTGLDRLPPTEKLRDGKGSKTGREEMPQKRKREEKASDDLDPQAEDGDAERGPSGKILDILI